MPARETALGRPLVLHADGVALGYGQHRVLTDVTFTLAPGETLAVVGPNGAGKTTLLRACLGLVPVAQGKMSAFGVELPAGRVSVMERTGYVQDAPAFYEHLTVREWFEFAARMRGLRGGTVERRWTELAPSLGLEGVAGEPARVLSFGLRKRLAVACALVHEPALLVLDEPMSGLDPRGVEAFWQALASRARQGVAVLISTHQLEMAERADGVLWLEEGGVRALGRPSEIAHGPEGELRRRFLGQSADPT